MNYIIKIILILLHTSIFLVVFPAIHIIAQEDIEDFTKEQNKKFEKLKKNIDREYGQLQKRIDEEFAGLLNKTWKEMQLLQGIVKDTTPKPDEIPVARPSKEPELKPIKGLKPAPPKSRDTEKHIQLKKKEGVTLSFVFFDTSLRIIYDKRLNVNLSGRISKSTISSFWETISKSDYQTCLEQVLQIKEQLKLNDWGYCILLDAVSKGIYGHSTNERQLFIWFMLLKSGYDARVGFVGNDVYLLIPSVQTIFGCPYYVLDNEKYYVTFLGTTEKNTGTLFTYDGSYKSAMKRIDFNMYYSPDISKKVDQKQQSFTYSDKNYIVSIHINKNGSSPI